MKTEILTVACLKDNYAFLVRNHDLGQTLLMDAPEARPIIEALNARNWSLDHVFLTHHHWDHVDGLVDLQKEYRPQLWGAAADQDRLPPLDHAVGEGHLEIMGIEGYVFDTPGHTVGHICLHLPTLKALFSADTLMAMGCGRLFEGTPAQMLHSLTKLMQLEEETLVYSGHEYTHNNAAFAQTILPNDADLKARVSEIHKMRGKNLPTVPSLLGLEKKTNPFLKCHESQLAIALGLEGHTHEQVFAELRRKKDAF